MGPKSYGNFDRFHSGKIRSLLSCKHSSLFFLQQGEVWISMADSGQVHITRITHDAEIRSALTVLT